MEKVTRAYVETINYCNARCKCCPCWSMSVPRRVMSLGEFKRIADKLKDAGINILAMYLDGEPLMDGTLFEKFRYAKEIGVLNDLVYLNTNASLLTKDMWEKVLSNTKQITITCYDTNEGYEDFTGLKWMPFFENVIGFVRYRNTHYYDYIINIGMNDVPGANIDKVKNAFSALGVNYITDAGVNWGKELSNVPRCGVEDGVILVKANGDCTTCCLDYNKENVYGNILTENVGTILGRIPQTVFPLCKRCDYKPRPGKE